MNGDECAAFEEQLEELAVGDLTEPERSRVLAHVSTCDACRRRLDELLAITDALLHLAPQHEPPPGFESRVLDRLIAPVAPERLGRRRACWLAAVAAAVLVVVAAGVVGWAIRTPDRGLDVARAGTIVAADGSTVGDIQLVRADRPYVLVTIDHPRPGGDEVTCELDLADGTTVVAGSWGYADVRSGVWAAGIDATSLDAVGMRIVDASGVVLATALLDPA